MISKSKLKELAIYKQQKHCDEARVFVVEGVKMCDEALAEKWPVEVVCAQKSWFERHPDIPFSAELFEVDGEALSRLSSLRTPNEVWMLLSRPATPLEVPRPSPFTLVLDHLQDPGNLGTIIRTADWFGIRHIVCSEGTVSCFNPKVVQATMGGIFRTRIDYLHLPDFLSRHGGLVYGALLDGTSIWSPDVPHPTAEPVALVIGNESRGITPGVQHFVTRRIAIPNLGGTAESLNASVACAILMAELCRPTV